MRKRPRADILTSSAPCNPSTSRWSPRMLLASRAEVLWRGAETAGVADAMIEAKRQVIHAAIHHGILAPLTKILPKSYDFSPWPPILHLLHSQQSSAMGSIHPSGCGRQPALWLGSFVLKRTCNRTMVMWAASGMSIESSDVLPILGRNLQDTSRTREGQTG